MKKLILTLTAAAMLTSCSAKNNAATETSKNGKSESSAAVEVNVENGTTAAVNADTENGTAAAANAKKAASSETDVSDTDALSVDGEEGQSPIMEIFEASKLPDEDAHEEELTAIDKLNKKYGREFEVVSRNVCWESWGEEVIDEDGTVHYENSESDPSEPLSIYYNMRDANGLEFGAYVKEDTDNITYDNYLYTQYKDQFDQDVGAALQRLLPDGKVVIVAVDKTFLPFESSANMSYEEFRQAFVDNGGKLTANVYVTDDMEVPDEMKNYRDFGTLEEFGCPCRILVKLVSQADYDSLKNISSDIKEIINGKIIN